MTLNGKVVSELSDCEFPFPRRERRRAVNYPRTKKKKKKKKANGLTDCASRCALLPAQGMKPQIIYSANECSTAGCGTLPDFSWDNVTITLSEAKKDLLRRPQDHRRWRHVARRLHLHGQGHRLEHPVKGVSAVRQSSGGNGYLADGG